MDMTDPGPHSSSPAATPSTLGSNGSSSPGSRRAEFLSRQVKVWTGQLVDLGGRNNLLYYRDLKRGTLDLARAPSIALDDVLVGKAVALSRLFTADEHFDEAVKRARTVRNKAAEHFEERGLETLYLSCGMATWTNPRGGATPCAPVLLCPARLAPRGAAQEEFDVSIVGELEVNPTLLQMMSADFGCHCDPQQLLDHAGIEGAIDTPDELDVVFEWLKDQASAIPGFDVAPRFVLGTFSYAKLPMVKDLEQSLEAMLAHDLIAALAGDAEARATLATGGAQIDVSDPNRVPPEDEYLILDADASQNYAINAAVSGQNLIVRGPPGTGKSQTISNLIATLVARGQKVLFVAEKRAAIDAVLKRLHAQGLDELVLDLHGGTSSKRRLAQGLAATLQANARIPRPDVAQVHRSVQRRRDELNQTVAAIHEPRDPWRISFFDAEARLLAARESSASDVRFRRDALVALGADAYVASRERLEDYVARGGLHLRTSGSPWATADIRTPEQGSSARDLVDRLLESTLPTARRLTRHGAQETDLRERAEFPVWRTWIELWREAEHVLESLEDNAFERDLQSLVVALAPLQSGSLKRMGAAIASSEYRTAKRTLKQLTRDGHRSSFEALDRAATLAGTWREHGHGAPAVPSELDAIAGAMEQLDRQLAEVEAFLPGSNPLAANADDLERGLRGLLADQATLNKLPILYELKTELVRLDLGALLKELARRQVDPEAALEIYAHAWLSSIVEEVGRTDPLIAGFDGTQHRRAVADYRQADRQHVETTALRVRRICAERAVAVQDEYREQSDLVRYQASLKRKHLPIRQLFEAAPDVLTALKPCWVMSPLLVSQLLPADQQYFDVVVFDEASQIEPADAIPAILRGKSVVVAGDDRQLPPTSFFATANSQEEDADTDPARLVVGTDFESILDALSAFMPMRMLLWHYRSRDERLIAFSNGHFYDRALTTFPGITENDCLEHVLVPFTQGYQGSDVSASAEVETVVDLILRHAAERPDESLGVIAMGLKHAERIDELLRLRLRDRPDLNDFFDETREEKFFVKNLERVQGDERDAIILSIGYGKGADGRLRYFFGPLNNQGGERRLNVAITRAKRRLTLVSSFASVDMDPEKGGDGVRLLRQYLQYAETRGANLGEAALAKPELNPFEIDVRDSLERAGVPVVAQWGCSGYFIDYVAKHPRDPGRLVLAIECDGAAYHSSATARDRDRLRQDHLERLGWKFHRIWSTDWFRDKGKEVDAAKAAYDRAVAEADAPGREREPIAGGQTTSVAVTTHPIRDPWPGGVRRGLPIGEYSPTDLEAVVRYVESDTLLRTQDELLQAVMDELRFRRRGKNIVGAIEAAISRIRR